MRKYLPFVCVDAPYGFVYITSFPVRNLILKAVLKNAIACYQLEILAFVQLKNCIIFVTKYEGGGVCPFFCRMGVDLLEVARWLAEYREIPELFVVDLRLEDGDDTLVIEADCDANISSDQCAALSSFISAKLDAIGCDITLMVSSPGLTSPLRHIRQYQKNLGETVVVHEGAEKWEGKMVEVMPEGFTIEFEQRERVEGKKRPVLVRRSKQFLFQGAQEVMIKLRKR